MMKTRVSIMLSRAPLLWSVIVTEENTEIFIYGTHDEIARFINKFSDAFLKTFPPDMDRYAREHPEFVAGLMKLSDPTRPADPEHFIQEPQPAGEPEAPTVDTLFLNHDQH